MNRLKRVAFFAVVLFVLTAGPAAAYLGCTDHVVVYGGGGSSCSTSCNMYDDTSHELVGSFSYEYPCE